jgi:hypothetical protein
VPPPGVLQQPARDRIIKLDTDVTDVASRSTVRISDVLYGWLAGPYKKAGGKVWNGTHYDFYRMQQTVAEKAGIEWKNNALRHTCISAAVATTRDVPQVTYESGNSPSII